MNNFSKSLAFVLMIKMKSNEHNFIVIKKQLPKKENTNNQELE